MYVKCITRHNHNIIHTFPVMETINIYSGEDTGFWEALVGWLGGGGRIWVTGNW